MNYDVVIVGGSFAGLSAAMQLVRAQRKVLVIDNNRPRNRFADASHGVFTLDGKSPQQIKELALEQLLAYPTFEFWNESVTDLKKTNEHFYVTTSDGQTAQCSRAILAMGVRDVLPNINGLSTYWGKNVVHCPYCHGYELRGQALGVLATSEMSFHQAAMLPDWGVTTLFSQGIFNPDGEVKALLQKRQVNIENTAIVSVEGDDSKLHTVHLADGRAIPLGGLYVAPKIEVNNAFFAKLSLEMTESPFGEVVKVNDFKESSLAGLFVAGDLSNPMQSGTLAVASGTLAGIGAHQSLIFR